MMAAQGEHPMHPDAIYYMVRVHEITVSASRGDRVNK
jgi:hypothetical protein